LYELEDTLNQIYALKETNKNKQHGIKDKKSEGNNLWNEFEPTNFIYSFFVFNYIYNYDWERSFDNNKLYESHEKYESNKIYKMIEYFIRTNEKKTIQNYIDILKTNLPYKYKKSFNILSNIRDNTEKSKKFLTAFEEIYEVENDINKYITKLKKIYYFIYKVRCNIFHGSKTEIQMIEHNQKQRMEIYTSLLLSINELFTIIAISESRGWGNHLVKRM